MDLILPGRVRAQYVTYMIAGLVAAALLLGLFISAQATLTIQTTQRLTPVSLSVSSDTSLPKDVQALEAASATYLFDRDTTTEHAVFGLGSVTATLNAPTNLTTLALYGDAPYRITVDAWIGGGWVTLDGLKNESLANNTPDAWQHYALSGISTSQLRFQLDPIKGKAAGSATGLKEIALWGGSQVPVNQAAAVDVTANQLSPSLIKFTAGEAEGVVSPTNGRRFTVTLDREPHAFTRAWLVYETYGYEHWMAPVRAINGSPALGGEVRLTQRDWTTSAEPIHPDVLLNGSNSIDFGLSVDARGAYTVRNVRVVAERDTGINLIQSSTVGGEPAHVIDHNTGTGWLLSDTGPAGLSGKPTLELNLSRPAQLEAVWLNINREIDGSLSLEYREGTGDSAKWKAATVPTLNGKKTSPGWNQWDTKGLPSTDGLRLVLQNGSGNATLQEVAVQGLQTGPRHPQTINVSYPDAGQYFGRTAFIRGYLSQPTHADGQVQLFAGGKAITQTHGGFEATITKDEIGLKDQADSDPWQVTLEAVYPDGTRIEQIVQLNNGDSSAQASSALPTAAALGIHGRGRHLKLDGAELVVDPDASDDADKIKIKGLKADELPPLDPGMTNVTRGPHAGYRFTPHGMKFKKKIQVTLPFDKIKVPKGMTDHDIQTFYYDTERGHWVVLEKHNLNSGKQELTSLTDHFTDMINATLTTPDNPQAVNFNPTQIKDIKAADPGAEINLIEAPQANNMGDARLSYPLQLPAGRAGMQPQLAIQYNSSGGNGWLGLGWDLSVPSISIDTRWGVPRYRADKETETYMFNGQQLSPVTHRTDLADLPARRAEKIFHTRVEGGFQKIIRHGDLPTEYWWEVIDKNGTRNLYGGVDADDNNGKLGGNKGVFKWMLRKTLDANGNVITYNYDRETDKGSHGDSAPGYQLYIKSIHYTGHNNQDGAYSVIFTRDTELDEDRRPDVTIDGRGRFKQTTASRLRKIEIKYNSSQQVRSYDLGYEIGPFSKSLLSAIVQRDHNGTEFNRHIFEYYKDILEEDDIYAGFPGGAVLWPTGDDDISNPYMPVDGEATALNSSYGISKGYHFYMGIGAPGETDSKKETAGPKSGYTDSYNRGLVSLTDIDGDNLPDKVFKEVETVGHRSTKYYYRKNLSGPDGNQVFGPKIEIDMPELSRSSSGSYTYGIEDFWFDFTAVRDKTNTTSKATTYFSDVNADGITDLVHNKIVHFGYLNSDGKPSFAVDSRKTPVEIKKSKIDPNIVGSLIDQVEIDRQITMFPLADTVRVWIAQYDGAVDISGDIALVKSNDPAREEYETADGVKVTIQHNHDVLWHKSINADDYASYTPESTENIQVNKGDRIYFRLQSVFDGKYDQVSWSPAITYQGAFAGKLDQNGLNPYMFDTGNDTIFADNSSKIKMPLAGVIKIKGTVYKAATSDNVEFAILRNGETSVSKSLVSSENTAVDIDENITVDAGDSIDVKFSVDSPVDLTKLSFIPEIYYVSTADGVPVVDDSGKNIFIIKSKYEINNYFNTDLIQPHEPWIAEKDEEIKINPEVEIDDATPVDGDIYFTIKRNGALVRKSKISIIDGVLHISGAQDPVAVTAGDKLFFSYSYRKDSLKNTIISSKVKILSGPRYESEELVSAPQFWVSRFASGFAKPYRGWTQIIYNGNKERASAPLPHPLEGITPSFDPETSVVYPMTASLSESRWAGHDEYSWFSSDHMSASRLGMDYIYIPTAAEYSIATAVNKESYARQFARGLGALGIVGSRTDGDRPTGIEEPTSYSYIDFTDVNGDRYPDVLAKGFVQYTAPTGTLTGGTAITGLGNKQRLSDNDSENFGVGGNPTHIVQSFTGKSKENNSIMPSIGVDYSRGNGESRVRYDMIDINGDGLLDRVDRGLSVRLNLGYEFGPPEPWRSSEIELGDSESESLGFGYNEDDFSVAFGISFNKSDNYVRSKLIDINGDGLPDYVSYEDGIIRVRFNTGSDFSGKAVWRGTNGKSVHKNKVKGRNTGVYYTEGIEFDYVKVVFNIGVFAGDNIAYDEITFRDIDGDGFVDHLKSKKTDEIEVLKNNTGYTNLLALVKRPLGGTIDIEYKRTGNTYTQPQSRWVMSKVKVFDGVEDAKSVGSDHQITRYVYEDGYHDRLERDFYGFGKVTLQAFASESADKPYRSVIQQYRTDSYYTKGLLASSRVVDGEEAEFTETRNTYELHDVFSSGLLDLKSTTGTGFPQLVETKRLFYEGGLGTKQTYSTFGYDDYGNVTEFADYGEQGDTSDDVFATMVYTGTAGSRHSSCTSKHIVGKAETITVKDRDGNKLRERQGDFNCSNGNMTELRQYALGQNAQIATTSMDYYANGNLYTVEGPSNNKGQRYKLTYVYDAPTQTYVTSITDSFGYTSTAEYDYKWGKPELTTDINGNSIVYVYDDVGRTEIIKGPYEQEKGAKTIEFVYTPYKDLDAAPFVSWAKTMHYDRDADDIAKDTIDTYLYIDGLKRVLQTKKDVAINGADKMTVSGRVVFDAFGRTIRQYYPSEEGKGSNDAFNSSVNTSVPPTVMEYDVLDRNTLTRLPDDAATIIKYNFGFDRSGANQFRTTVTDARLNKKETYRNVRELITSVKEINNTPGQAALWTSYTYDAVKQIRQIKDAGENLTTVDYDTLGRRTLIDNPDTGATVYRYDPAGNLSQKITANLDKLGMAINYGYDFNRLSTIVYPQNPGNNVSYVYGAAGDKGNGLHQVGLLKHITHGGGTDEREYGQLGEVVSETRTPNTQQPLTPYTTKYEFDTFGRLLNLTFPDGEKLVHTYDSGGNITHIEGFKQGSNMVYLDQLHYDRFEQRSYIKYGNGVESRYAYDANTRRLCRLDSGASVNAANSCTTLPDQPGTGLQQALTGIGAAPATQFQSLHYAYDKVGNILGTANAVTTPKGGDFGGPVIQTYNYDNLYRLTGAEGTFTPGKQDEAYTLAMAYDGIHNITNKTQRHVSLGNNGTEKVIAGTSYDWAYTYKDNNHTQPHAPTHIGLRSFDYDLNGNQTGWTHDQQGSRRTIAWDEENRITSITDQGTTSFKYDDQGQRVLKDGDTGQIAYINQYYTVKNNAIPTKHVYAGTTRIVSKRLSGGNTTTAPGNWNDTKGNNGNGKGNTPAPAPAATTPAPATTAQADTPLTGPGKSNALQNRSARANERAQNTNKNPHLNGTGHPGQGINNRSDRANERAQNTAKNPNLNGAAVPPGNGGGNGSAGGNGNGNAGGNSAWQPEQHFLYYYHPDHLGSTSYVTDHKGEVYEHLQYFPFGETWIQQAHNTERTPYQYTAKELDEETGLYYYGARYYDPRTSVWQSADPILGKYLTGKGGIGGVFVTINMGLYTFSHNNPVILRDLDGREINVAHDGANYIVTGDVNGSPVWSYINKSEFNQRHGRRLGELHPQIRIRSRNTLLGMEAAGWQPISPRHSSARTFSKQLEMFSLGASGCANPSCAHVDDGAGSIAIDIVDRNLWWTDWLSDEGVELAGSFGKAVENHMAQRSFWSDLESLYSDEGFPESGIGAKWGGRDFITGTGKDPAHAQWFNRIRSRTDRLWQGVMEDDRGSRGIQ